jgi:GTP-binding protein HflX
VWICAASENAQAAGLELLRQAIVERLDLRVRRLWLRLPASAGALRARLYASGVVRDERTMDDGQLELLVDLPASEAESWAAQPGVHVLEALPPGLAATCAEEQPYLESGETLPAAMVRC